MRTLLLFATLTACSGATTGSPLPDFSSSAGDLAGSGNDDQASGAGLVVNEAYPHGSDPATDPDWVELKNLSSSPISLKDYTLADSQTTANLPDVIVVPGGYTLILCDDAPDGGASNETHVPFKLAGSGDEVHLKKSGNAVDKTSWGANDVPTGKSWARLPDGTGDFAAATPTKLATNLQ